MDWQQLPAGIAIGVVSTILADWLLHYLKRKRRKGEYFDSTSSGDYLEFEGRVRYTPNLETLIPPTLVPHDATPTTQPPQKHTPRKRTPKKRPGRYPEYPSELPL